MTQEGERPAGPPREPALPGTPLPRRRNLSLDDYFTGVRSGNIAILARALTLIESNHPHHILLQPKLS